MNSLKCSSFDFRLISLYNGSKLRNEPNQQSVMKPSKMKEIHERHNPGRKGFDHSSFFKYRDGLTIHRVYKVDDNRYYLVFSTDRTFESSSLHYRVAKFYSPTGKIRVLGYDTYASKFRKKSGVPLPDDIEHSLEMLKKNGHSGWISGTRIHG